jgi:DNA-binding MarR family transcriptional regulator
MIPTNNIRGLVQDLSEQLDSRMDQLRQGTDNASVRPADAKMFMLISRKPRTVSKLASALNISRQAAHSAVQRLVERGVVALEFAPDNKRDKIPRVTEKGQAARKIAALNINTLETELGALLGEDKREQLRSLLGELNQALKDNSQN